MAGKRASGGSGRQTLSLAVTALGAILLVIVPVTFVVLATTGQKAQIEGILVIVTSTLGMALVVVGAALRD